MEKLTVYGELCVDEYGTEWNTEVDLEDEQVRNIIKILMLNGGDTDVERMCLKEAYPDIYDILDKACYKATLDAYNEYLRSCGKPEVDKLDFKHEVNLPYKFQDMF